MSNSTLAAVGEALHNIAATINECVRADATETHSPGHAAHFEESLANECRRLRSIGQEGIAGALEVFSAPMARLMREGW